MPLQTKLPPLSNDWLKAIGRVVVESSRLDRAIERVIWGFLKLDEFGPGLGPALTTHIPVPLMLDIIGSLADKLLDDVGKGEISQLIARIKELRSDRNLTVHGEWVPLINPQIIKVTSRAAVKKQSYEPTLPMIEQIADNLKKLADDLEALRWRIHMKPVQR